MPFLIFSISYTLHFPIYFLPFFLPTFPSFHLVIFSSFHRSIYLPFPPSISIQFPSTDSTIPPFHGTLRLYRHSAAVALNKGPALTSPFVARDRDILLSFCSNGAFDPDCSLCSLITRSSFGCRHSTDFTEITSLVFVPFPPRPCFGGGFACYLLWNSEKSRLRRAYDCVTKPAYLAARQSGYLTATQAPR